MPPIEQSIDLDLKAIAKRTLPLLDLTSLNDDDTDESVKKLCGQAITPFGHVAAVCIYPKFVSLAAKLLQNTAIKIATVVNFPKGDESVDTVVRETAEALHNGADEIDVVIPYRDVLNGDFSTTDTLVRACVNICAQEQAKLKVILETGELKDRALIEKVSDLVANTGADFLKTSTGKVSVNATLDAAHAMLRVCQSHRGEIGFKAAGGVRTVEQAAEYLALADQLLGSDWVDPTTFRFGASALLADILQYLRAS